MGALAGDVPQGDDELGLAVVGEVVDADDDLVGVEETACVIDAECGNGQARTGRRQAVAAVGIDGGLCAADLGDFDALAHYDGFEDLSVGREIEAGRARRGDGKAEVIVQTYDEVAVGAVVAGADLGLGRDAQQKGQCEGESSHLISSGYRTWRPESRRRSCRRSACIR